MSYRKTVDELMERKMDRAEFFRYVGIATIAIVGLARLLEGFGSLDKPADNSFGAGPYGGVGDGRQHSSTTPASVRPPQKTATIAGPLVRL